MRKLNARSFAQSSLRKHHLKKAMLKRPCQNLSLTTAAYLQKKQDLVDAELTHLTQYDLAVKLFGTKTSKAWTEVKKKLAAGAPNAKACFYCERDRHSDIEHVQPKRHYPTEAFKWSNYVFACTFCNQKLKSDKFAVIDMAGTLIEFDRNWDITIPLPIGTLAFINPRNEDPFSMMMLDLATGRFVPTGTSLQKQRTRYTIKLLQLNNESLNTIRKTHYRAYKTYLEDLNNAVVAKDTKAAEKLQKELLKVAHPTVVTEMRRQGKVDANLAALFTNAPPKLGSH